MITGVAAFPIIMGLVFSNYKDPLLALFFIVIIGFVNGLIVQKDLTRSVVVFSFTGIIFVGALISWALIYPAPETTVESNEDEILGKLVFVPLTGGVVLVILAYFSVISLFLIVPIMWISGFIGSKVIMKFQQRRTRIPE
jgi:hypothetical protein